MFLTGKLTLLHVLLLFSFIHQVDMIKCDPLNHKYYHQQLSECLDCEKCLPGNEKIDLSEWHFEYNQDVGPTRCRPCKPCSPGTYSDARAFKCQRCKNCTLYKQYEVKECTQLTDSVCDGILDHATPEPKEIRTDTIERPFAGDNNNAPVKPLIVSVTVLAVVVIVLFVGFLIYIYWKKKYRGNRRKKNNERYQENDIESGSSSKSRTNGESNGISIREKDASHRHRTVHFRNQDIQDSNESKCLLDDTPKNAENNTSYVCDETTVLKKEWNDEMNKHQMNISDLKGKTSQFMNERRNKTNSGFRGKKNVVSFSEQTPLMLRKGRRRYYSLPCDENDESCFHDLVDDVYGNTHTPSNEQFENNHLVCDSSSGIRKHRLPFSGRKKTGQRKYSLTVNSFENNVIDEEKETTSDVFEDSYNFNGCDTKGVMVNSDTTQHETKVEKTNIVLPEPCNGGNNLEIPITNEQMRILSGLCITSHLDMARCFGLTERDLTQIKYDNRFESLPERSYQIFVKIKEKGMSVTLEEIRSCLFKLDKHDIWNEFLSK